MMVLQILLGLIVCLGAFGFIIFIHELGHFLVAVRAGVYCPNFAIGFGPVIFGFRRKGTHFSLRLFPIGGYVQMIGEDPNADRDGWQRMVTNALYDVQFPTTPGKILETLPPGEVSDHIANLPQDRVVNSIDDLDGNFNHRSVRERLAIILGGVMMNFVAACLLMWFLGWTVGIGMVGPLLTSRLGDVRQESAAYRAGVRPGDVVMSLADAPILSGGDLIQTVARYPGQEIPLVYQRGKEQFKVKVTPDIVVRSNLFFAGAGPVTKLKYTLTESDPSGLQPKDVIVGVNDRPVTTPASFVQALKAELEGQTGANATLVLHVKDKPDVKLEGARASLNPVGKLGVTPIQVTSIRFLSDTTNVVEGVTPGSPAEKAGLKPGDKLYEIGKSHVFGLSNLNEILRRLQEGRYEPMELLVLRGDREGVELELKERPPADAASFGITLQPITAMRILESPFERIYQCLTMPVDIVRMLMEKRITASEVRENSQGPLGMMQMLFELSDNGWADVLWFVAFLNAAVGAFNLIPFPALDGSRALLLIVGAIRGRDLNPEKEALLHLAGMAILLCVVVMVTFQDIGRWWAGTPLMK